MFRHTRLFPWGTFGTTFGHSSRCTGHSHKTCSRRPFANQFRRNISQWSSALHNRCLKSCQLLQSTCLGNNVLSSRCPMSSQFDWKIFLLYNRCKFHLSRRYGTVLRRTHVHSSQQKRCRTCRCWSCRSQTRIDMTGCWQMYREPDYTKAHVSTALSCFGSTIQ